MQSPPSSGADPTLYITDLSPFGARLRLVSSFTGSAFNEVPPPDGAGSDAMKAVSHFGKMPAIDLDGKILIESLALMEYLVERAGGSSLVPQDIEERCTTRSIMLAHDNYVLGAIWPMFLQLRTGKPDPAIVTAALSAADQQYAVLAGLFSKTSDFAVGTSVSLADLAIAPFALLNGAVYVKFGQQDPFAVQERLVRWKAATMALPEVSKRMAVMQGAVTKVFG